MGTTKIRGGAQVLDNTITLDDLDFTVPANFTDLGDVPSSYTTFSGILVRVNDTENGIKFSNIISGNITVVGGITIGDGVGSKALRINGAVGESRDIQFETNGVDRWLFRVNSDYETGGNAGSNLELVTRTDLGESLQIPLSINRSTGRMVLASQLTVNDNVIVVNDGRIGGGLYVGATDIDPDSGVIIATSDIYTVPWTDYSAISTIEGWSSYTVKQILYKKVGKLCFVTYQISGTSNATYTRFTIPFTNGVVRLDTPPRCVDNGGTAAWGVGVIAASDGWLTFYSTPQGAPWTASGLKQVQGQFFYQVA